MHHACKVYYYYYLKGDVPVLFLHGLWQVYTDISSKLKFNIHYPTLHLSKYIKNKKASYMPTHGIPYDLSSFLFNCLKQSYWDMMYVQRTSPMGQYSVRDVPTCMSLMSYSIE